MKDQITGYLTAVINGYERTICKLNTLKISTSEINKYENFKDVLCDLLDFVEDLEEEKKIEEAEGLRKRIRELEESCENDCKIIRNLHKQIEELKKSGGLIIWR